VILFSGPWAEDYSSAVFGNAFTGVSGPPLCVLAP
jgi:hypothetical protein